MSPARDAPASFTRSDATLRAAYLDEVLRLLYPRPGTGRRGFVVLPSVRRPRVLVPAESSRLGALAVRRYAEPKSPWKRLQRDAAALALWGGVGRIAFRDRLEVSAGPGDIEHHLRGVLGTDLTVSVHIGPARADRKPVLQLLAPDGSTVGFAKLGPAPLTRRLVLAEAAALELLGRRGTPGLTVPTVWHAGRWRDAQLLVHSALPVWRRRTAVAPDRLAAAMRALATTGGVYTQVLRVSPYWSRLRDRLRAVADHPEGRALAEPAATLQDRAGDIALDFGCWHGDWSPWNMAVLPDTLLVWDWERFATGVPLGFDALHFCLQRSLQAGGFGRTVDAGVAVEDCLANARWTLGPQGVPDVAAAHLTALLYLLDLACRYVEDRQANAGARLGVSEKWLLQVLVRRVSVIGQVPGLGGGR